MLKFSNYLLSLKDEVMEEAKPYFSLIDRKAEENTLKVLEAMRRYRISEAHFSPTAGYAYDDLGRKKVEDVYARVFGAKSALVRTQFVSGTHALATALFGILRPGDEILSALGTPYDTIQTVIGYAHESLGSLKEFGILYDEVPLLNGKFDKTGLAKRIKPQTKVVLIQRSRGYSLRAPLSLADIKTICLEVKRLSRDAICLVDNCYGEFVNTLEPLQGSWADLIVGSLIKNPGGGLALTGGYIAGRADLVELSASRLTAPGIGGEQGASLVGNRALLQGLFMAPHVVAGAIKGAIFAAGLFSRIGYNTIPKLSEPRNDIIQAIELGSAEKLIAFCQGLQKYSPVDAYATPQPAPMPGYADDIIMAAGTFVQGASIELSADGPMREPYVAYLQGGLTFEHAVIGALGAAEAVLEMG